MKSKQSTPLGKEENKLFLRQLELEAYASLVSALRAEGPLTQDKCRLLEETRKILHVSIDMHKSEIRRAVNDEKLCEIFYYINGPLVTWADWMFEGRKGAHRLPLVQKISPQTLQPVMSCDYPQFEAPTAQNNKRNSMHENNSVEIKMEEVVENNNGVEPKKLINSPSANCQTTTTTTRTSNSNQQQSEAKKPLVKRLKLTNYYTVQTNDAAQKTLLVATDKINKLNVEKFKIISKGAFLSAADSEHDKIKTLKLPHSTAPLNTRKITRTIIPLSQFQLLNYNLKTKGAIKLLPVNGSLLNKNLNNTIRITTTTTTSSESTTRRHSMETDAIAPELEIKKENQETDDSNQSQDASLLRNKNEDLNTDVNDESKVKCENSCN